MIDTAKLLLQSEPTRNQGREMMEQANDMFREVKEHIIARRKMKNRELDEESHDGMDSSFRSLIRKKYSDHDLERAAEDEKRALDIARRLYETMVTFPECVDQLFQDCLDIINSEIAGLGLSTIEVVVHEKRNLDQDGYNKVVIITNELADRVKGKSDDGMVEYPWVWNDMVTGPRTLGVAGKWNCQFDTPEDCCAKVKQSAPNVDNRGKHIECHIFVPYGGVGNPRRNDRVFIVVSQDGRVHEPPIIQ